MPWKIHPENTKPAEEHPRFKGIARIVLELPPLHEVSTREDVIDIAESYRKAGVDVYIVGFDLPVRLDA